VIRIANGQGFWGDSLEAPLELMRGTSRDTGLPAGVPSTQAPEAIAGTGQHRSGDLCQGPIDYLTLDYLAEITMSILQKQRARDPRTGYARDFVGVIEQGAREIVERGIKVIANAGGDNP
jgi:hypothetical protein